MDLQLAYLAAPQNAAQASAAQQAPAASQQAAQAAFASKLEQREETVAETSHAEGTKVRTNPDGGGNGAGGYTPGRRHHAQHQEPDPAADLASGDGEHFIDVIA